MKQTTLSRKQKLCPGYKKSVREQSNHGSRKLCQGTENSVLEKENTLSYLGFEYKRSSKQNI